jgi:hypothetical protein
VEGIGIYAADVGRGRKKKVVKRGETTEGSH